MKDSKNKLKKSSSESKILETKTVPPMPKDKRTKEYKEWYKKYGEIDKKDKKPKSKKNQSIKQKKETLDIPPMPKEKRPAIRRPVVGSIIKLKYTRLWTVFANNK